MTHAKLYAISASYEIRDEKTYAVIYGKTSKGNTVKVVTQFDPYCIVEGLEEAHLNKLEHFRTTTFDQWRQSGENTWDYIEVRNVEPIVLKHRDGSTHQMHKITVATPRDVPRVRKWLQTYQTAYSADILYPLRFYYSHNLGAYFQVQGKLVNSNTLVDNTTRDMEEKDYFMPKFKIISFDIENSMNPEKDGEIFVISAEVYDQTNDRVEMFSFRQDKLGHEESVINGFRDLVIKEDPDIITGYNIDNYDWPKILYRASKLGTDFNIGRDGSQVRLYGDESKHAKIVGRVSFDVYKMVHKDQGLMLPNEDLDSVARELDLGSKTAGVDGSKIDILWAENPDLAVTYCENDASLALKIALHPLTNYFERGVSMGIPSMLPLEETINPVSSRLIDSVLIRRFEELGYATPTHKGFDQDNDEEEEEYEGGFVLQPRAGVYNLVLVLDFKSMYPSQEMENNICWLTYIGEEKGIGKSNDKSIAVPFERALEYDKNKNPTKTEWVTHRFLRHSDLHGVIPQVMEKYMKWRQDAKNKYKHYKEVGNEGKATYYDNLQYSIKVLMNAFYGVLGSHFYRYSFQEIAESITGASRNTIQDTIDYIEKTKKFSVLYTDTDSVFVLTNKDYAEEVKAVGEEIAQALSHGYLQLEFEDIFSTWFNHGKKKYYIGKSAITGKRKVRGYALRRRDSFQLQKDILQDVLFSIVDNKEMDKVFNDVKAKLLFLRAGEIDPKELVITKSVKEFKHYKDPDSLVQVRVAKKLLEIGYPWMPGQRVSYIITDGSSPLTAEPVIPGRPLPSPDLKYYEERIITMLGGTSSKKPNILAVFGWDKKAIRTGLKQRRLDAYSE